ncbi:hypothetical protein STEG23_021579 [Scotinomys teguina]
MCVADTKIFICSTGRNETPREDGKQSHWHKGGNCSPRIFNCIQKTAGNQSNCVGKEVLYDGACDCEKNCHSEGFVEQVGTAPSETGFVLVEVMLFNR